MEQRRTSFFAGFKQLSSRKAEISNDNKENVSTSVSFSGKPKQKDGQSQSSQSRRGSLIWKSSLRNYSDVNKRISLASRQITTCSKKFGKEVLQNASSIVQERAQFRQKGCSFNNALRTDIDESICSPTPFETSSFLAEQRRLTYSSLRSSFSFLHTPAKTPAATPRRKKACVTPSVLNTLSKRLSMSLVALYENSPHECQVPKGMAAAYTAGSEDSQCVLQDGNSVSPTSECDFSSQNRSIPRRCSSTPPAKTPTPTRTPTPTSAASPGPSTQDEEIVGLLRQTHLRDESGSTELPLDFILEESSQELDDEVCEYTGTENALQARYEQERAFSNPVAQLLHDREGGRFFVPIDESASPYTSGTTFAPTQN